MASPRPTTSLLLALIAAGVVVGALVSSAWPLTLLFGETRWLAIAVGAALGALSAVVLQQARRIDALERRLQPDQASPGSATVDRRANETPAPPPAASAPSVPAPSPSIESTARPEAPPEAAAAIPRARRDGQAAWTGWARLNQWLQTGNIPVKVGALVSLIGVAALLRYASEQGWLRLAIEWRLSAVAALAVAALVFAWRQRHRRRAFALALQGLSIGVLVLTVFAASRLYDLLPSGIAFGLIVVLVFGGGVLAAAQRALVLAVLAMTAGFAAPFLIGGPSGDPTALFTWYAVLNLGVFGISWARSWPLLNRIGFFFTFVLSTLWGVLSWTPSDNATAQIFLLIYALLYLLIPILQAFRQPQGRLDAVLVFGLPLIAFPLQIALLGDDRFAIALAALVAAMVYLASAVALFRWCSLPTLGRAHAVLALGFATLAVPFAVSGPTLTMIWALEGAALVWFGALQAHRLSRISGLLLQGAAGGVWLVELALSNQYDPIPLINPIGLGGIALAVAGMISAWRYDQAGAGRWRVNLLATWSLAFWIIALTREIDAYWNAGSAATALVALFALTGLLGAVIHRRRGWGVAGITAVGGPAVCALLVFAQYDAGSLLTVASLGAWIGLAGVVVGVDTLLSRQPQRWRLGSTLTGHAAVATAMCTAAAVAPATALSLGDGWQWLSGGLPLLALTGWLLSGGRAPLAWRRLSDDQQQVLTVLALLALVAGLCFSLFAVGAADPLTWRPLLNPLEIAQLLGLVLLVQAAVREKPELPPLVPAALGLALASAMALRGVHHLAGIDWQLAELLDSDLAQASLSIVWTALGVIAWIAGSRRGSTALWWAGAALLAVVLVKLIAIDRQFLSTVAGILSFLAFGLLSIVVGYLAPAPPRSTAHQEESR